MASPAAVDKLTSIIRRHDMTLDLKDELVALRDEIAAEHPRSDARTCGCGHDDREHSRDDGCTVFGCTCKAPPPASSQVSPNPANGGTDG